MSAIELSSMLLPGHLSLDDQHILVDRKEHVNIGRIMKQLETKISQVKKLDDNTLKKLFTSLELVKDGSYFDNNHSIDQYPKLMSFYETSLTPKFQSLPDEKWVE